MYGFLLEYTSVFVLFTILGTPYTYLIVHLVSSFYVIDELFMSWFLLIEARTDMFVIFASNTGIINATFVILDYYFYLKKCT